MRHSQKRVSKSISADFGEDSRHSPGGLDNEPVMTLRGEESETGEVLCPIVIRILFSFWNSVYAYLVV